MFDWGARECEADWFPKFWNSQDPHYFKLEYWLYDKLSGWLPWSNGDNFV